MIFNKKLIALAVAITAASSTFAMEAAVDDGGVKKAARLEFSVPTTFAGAKEMAYDESIAITRWAANKTYSICVYVDGYSGSRLSAAGNWALGYVQSADAFIAGKLQGSRLEACYIWPKETGKAFYTRMYNTLYPKSE